MWRYSKKAKGSKRKKPLFGKRYIRTTHTQIMASWNEINTKPVHKSPRHTLSHLLIWTNTECVRAKSRQIQSKIIRNATPITQKYFRSERVKQQLPGVFFFGVASNWLAVKCHTFNRWINKKINYSQKHCTCGNLKKEDEWAKIVDKVLQKRTIKAIKFCIHTRVRVSKTLKLEVIYVIMNFSGISKFGLDLKCA